MSAAEPPVDPLTPAEQRLRTHLEVLHDPRDEPDDPSFVPQTVRTAKWQRTVRAPLRLAGLLAAATIEGIVLVVGGRSGRRRT